MSGIEPAILWLNIGCADNIITNIVLKTAFNLWQQLPREPHASVTRGNRIAHRDNLIIVTLRQVY
jgi:hypothetical protein